MLNSLFFTQWLHDVPIRKNSGRNRVCGCVCFSMFWEIAAGNVFKMKDGERKKEKKSSQKAHSTGAKGGEERMNKKDQVLLFSFIHLEGAVTIPLNLVSPSTLNSPSGDGIICACVNKCVWRCVFGNGFFYHPPLPLPPYD